jgi:hypothetical protein
MLLLNNGRGLKEIVLLTISVYTDYRELQPVPTSRVPDSEIQVGQIVLEIYTFLEVQAMPLMAFLII